MRCGICCRSMCIQRGKHARATAFAVTEIDRKSAEDEVITSDGHWNENKTIFHWE